jgi:hypothetical protein
VTFTDSEHRPVALAVEAETAGEDMRDPPRWLKSATLGPVLRLCDGVLGQPFLDADGDALESQTSHRHLTTAAAAGGLLAILIALVHFALRAENEPGTAWPYAEGLAILAALVAVLLGLRATMHQGWIRDRHRAELIRALKFRLITEPIRWAGGPTQLKNAENWLKDELRRIGTLTRGDVSVWARSERAPRPPTLPAAHKLPPPMLRDLVGYYVERRLRYQKGYFPSHGRPRGFPSWFLRNVGQYLFVLTGLAVILHFGLDKLGAHFPDAMRGLAQSISPWILFAAALLPALGATIRALRLANEADRNRERARAKEIALRGMIIALTVDHSQEGILTHLWTCEQVLEWDHREWVRLMTEAEWFG